MPQSISTAFIKQYEREVHTAYQMQGSKLRGFVRNVSNVIGSTCTFQKVGKGTASQKTTHGLVPVMNVNHTSVEVTLHDYYAGDWADKLDENKINIDEKKVLTDAGAYALGRKTDDLIITALASASTLTVPEANIGMTLTKVYAAMEKLGNADVPDDGNRTAVVGWKQWGELLNIDEFSNSQFIGDADLPFKGLSAKKWLGTTWIAHPALPVASDIRKCFWFHKNAVGHASGSDVQTDITWHGERAAWFINNMMSQGAGLIDGNGVVVIECDETPD